MPDQFDLEHIQAVITLFSLVNPMVCAMMFASLISVQSAAQRTLDGTRAIAVIAVVFACRGAGLCPNTRPVRHIFIRLLGSGQLRLAATGRYRIGAYEEDGSDFLSGMGDRKSTLMAGMALTAELPKGVDLSVSYSHDVLGEIGGGEMGITLERSFPVGPCRLSPKVGLHWLSSKLADHDFGVPPSKATPNRPAYSLDSAISGEIGLGFFIEITQDWLVVLNITLELLDRDVVGSPIVSEDYRVQGFSAISYVF